MRTSRIVLTLIGAVLALLGFVACLTGATLVVVHATQRDSAGFYTSGRHVYATPTAAIVTRGEIHTGATSNGDWVPVRRLGTLRIRATSSQPIFIGVGPKSDVERWLAGVEYDRLKDVSLWPFRTHYERHSGVAQAGPPTAQPFWVAQATGAASETLRWDVTGGKWALVVMNADGRPGVRVNADVGVRTGVLLPAGLIAGGIGLVLLAGGVGMAVAGTRGARDLTGSPGRRPAPTDGSEPAYPVRVDGRLDEPLSRWLWLVKWVLIIPHVIVLAFLWSAVVVLTVVAWFAIVFTGRYPRSLFDFNVGVMRWTWRVGFYTLSAFGTDRYPPFTLEPDPDYPADLAIDYPEHLSRGLVWMKSWLLAIPHLVIVGIFAGGLGASWSGSSRVASGGGLIAIIAIIAIIAVAFTARYPRGLFDFLMGMNRWCYRVLAYVALMRDEYPPLRFDSGGTDPGSAGDHPVSPAPPAPPAPPPAPPPSDAPDLVTH
jgi:hypothetical protein